MEILKPHIVDQHAIAVTGSLVKLGQLNQELYFEVEEPASLIDSIKRSPIKMDVFTFLERFPQSKPQYDYHMEWDNFAALEITTFEDWHKNRIPKATRRGLRKAAEAGIEVRPAPFNDELVRQVGEIFNESPFRQGRPFWHYGKDFAAVKEAISRDFDRSRFIGAYIGEELIGFIKLIRGRNFTRTTLIMSKIAHRNKYPNNALVAKVVEICVAEKIPYAVYGQIEYGNVGSSTLADFKTNNGFVKFPLPRYYVPLNRKGELALKLGLHRGLVNLAPRNLVQFGLRMRARWYARKARAFEATRGSALAAESAE